MAVGQQATTSAGKANEDAAHDTADEAVGSVGRIGAHLSGAGQDCSGLAVSSLPLGRSSADGSSGTLRKPAGQASRGGAQESSKLGGSGISHSGSGQYQEQVFGGLGVGLQAVVSGPNDSSANRNLEAQLSIGGEVNEAAKRGSSSRHNDQVRIDEVGEATNKKNRHHAKPKARTRSSRKKDAKARSIGHY